jgi:DNA-binding MarR family transcriptional regulator
MVEEKESPVHSAMCLRLMALFPRITRGMRRYQDGTIPDSPAALGPRHIAALEELRAGPLGVGELATRLDLTLSTVSGVLADLDRAGYVRRTQDCTDRRRTTVEIAPERRVAVVEWLDGAAAPLSRVLDQLGESERAAFVKALDLLELELSGPGGDGSSAPGPSD